VAQLARLARPGGTVVVVDFFRRHGGVSERLAQRMARMDAIFATAGNWKSAQEFSSMMGEWAHKEALGWGNGMRRGGTCGWMPPAQPLQRTASEASRVTGLLHPLRRRSCVSLPPAVTAQPLSITAAANGLQVVKREDWSDRIRGFWSIPLLELLFRQGHGTQALHARALEGCLRVREWSRSWLAAWLCCSPACETHAHTLLVPLPAPARVLCVCV
jgi:hypothetical protein